MSDIYPGIPDWDRYVLDSMPAVSRAGDGSAWMLGLMDCFADIETSIEQLARQFADIEFAGSYALQQRASEYGTYERGAMPLEAYRRIVAGLVVASRSDYSMGALTATMRALCGTREVEVERIQGGMAVQMQGVVGFEPSTAWLSMAGRVIDVAVYDAAEWEAVVYQQGHAVWGESVWGSEVGYTIASV